MLAWAVLLLCGGIVAYTIIGYPLILALRRGRTAAAVRKDSRFQTTVSVILAVHNGGEQIRGKLGSLLALDYPQDLLEILVASDGSTDDTERITEEFRDRGVRLLKLPRGGKAAALNAAMKSATGELLFFTDVRQPLDRQALRHLVANFADPTVGAVTGELRLLRSSEGRPVELDLYWRYELWARRRHSQIDSMFNTTGCIYAIRRELAAPIPTDTLIDDAVIPLGIFFKGYRVIFDPEAIAFDDPSLFATGFRRRLRTLGGLWQTYARLPRLLTGENRMRFHFTSHKFLRLILPWAIAGGMGVTLALPAGGARTGLITADCAFFVLAAVDCLVPAGFPLKRLSSAARTFLLVNAAALAALVVFFVPSAKLWSIPAGKKSPSSSAPPV